MNGLLGQIRVRSFPYPVLSGPFEDLSHNPQPEAECPRVVLVV